MLNTALYSLTVKSNRNEGSLSEATDAVTVTTFRRAPTGLQASETHIIINVSSG
jgi:hypothetical protein